jgi:dCMP deaminase
MRPTWDEYFMEIARVIAKRSPCLRRQVGAVIVKRNNAILATGYNGVPPGVDHCKTCMRQELGLASGENQELCRALHAEQNALLFVENRDALYKATIYVTYKPCTTCDKMLLASGIRKVVYDDSLTSIAGKKQHYYTGRF